MDLTGNAEAQSFLDDDLAQQAYALDLIGGKYLPDDGQMVQSAIGRLPVEYSQQNQALVSNIASNNLSGSGFQRREGMQLNQNQAYETQTKRQQALQEHSEKKRQQAAEGNQLLLDMEDRKKRDQAIEEEKKRQRSEEHTSELQSRLHL